MSSAVKKKKAKRMHPVKRTFMVIGATLLSLILIVVITISIIAAALTVYIFQFQDQANDVTLDLYSLEMDYTTIIYAYDKSGNPVEIQQITRGADRKPISIEQVPQHVQDAFVYIEDERFYDHTGVDWKRTFSAFVNVILDNIFGYEFGGSTITQQIIKNVTGDDDQSWDRKVREIFRAQNIEETCTKADILQAYLNYIGFGGNTAGIQAAANKYFGKDVSELTIAEAACLAAIPKSPNTLNPFSSYVDKEGNTALERNEKRRQLVLKAMLDNGAISQDQYEEACNTKLLFRDPDAPVEDENSLVNEGVQSYFVDMVIRDVTYGLMDEYGIDFDEAQKRLYNGGYKIYSTVDIDMQKAVEAKFEDYTTFSAEVLANPPHAAFVAMDYMGNILAVVGDVGEKPIDNSWNYATREPRQPGSCIKPITAYGYAIENDLIHWSTIFTDKPITIKDANAPGGERQWPQNYSNRWSYGGYYTFQALLRSLNTIPAQLIQMEGPTNVYNFLQSRFHITTLTPYDADLAPLSVGALDNGILLTELVGAYQVFGNLGKFYEPTSYSMVIDPTGNAILQNTYTPVQALDKDSAYVMNKLLECVIEDQVSGTGRAAKLPTKKLVGKTGTSQNWGDIAFVGCTPDYVSGVWYGYDDRSQSVQNTYYSSAKLWKNIFGDIAEAGPVTNFPSNSNVKELYYCANTGMIASGLCPTGAKGYYKPSNIPPVCTSCGAKPSQTVTTQAQTEAQNTAAAAAAQGGQNAAAQLAQDE